MLLGLSVVLLTAATLPTSAVEGPAAQHTSVCRQDNLLAEEAELATLALLLGAGSLEVTVAPDPDPRCVADGEALDCSEPLLATVHGPRLPAAPGLTSAGALSAGRCDVRLGGRMRAHLRPWTGRPAPQQVLALLHSQRDEQPGLRPIPLKRAPSSDGGGDLLSQSLDDNPPLRPPLIGLLPDPPTRPLHPGHRDRIDRPPR